LSLCCFSVPSCSLSIDVDNIIVSSQFLLKVIFSPSSSILKWCSINADSSSRLLLFFIRRAAEQPSFSSFVARPGARSVSSLVCRVARRQSSSFFVAPPGCRATTNFFLPHAAGRLSISSFVALLGANLYYLHSSRRRAPIHFIFTPCATGRPSISSLPHAAGRLTKSNLFQFADGRSSRIIVPTGDHQEASRQRAPLQSYSSIAPTGAPPILFKH
jgi:hypothetical protein